MGLHVQLHLLPPVICNGLATYANTSLPVSGPQSETMRMSPAYFLSRHPAGGTHIEVPAVTVGDMISLRPSGEMDYKQAPALCPPQVHTLCHVTLNLFPSKEEDFPPPLEAGLAM